ncbi:MAG: hypothetical protein IJU76_07000 [Desulfovibrionaceae bacterium]|nr:hypothetical protein [Desulfovibrionaceae bacterium]
MLLWAAHLADLPQKVLGTALPAQENTALLRQIERSPRKVLEWDPLASRTVAQMYLGAFFAYADMRYIDALLDTTKLFTRLQKEGRLQDPLYARAQTVAALLYEMAKRHPCVRRHIEDRRKKLSGLEASLLDRILALD